MSEETVYLQRREWLNTQEHGGTAFIEAAIRQYGDDSYPYGDITMSDCSRQITLEFSLHKESRENNLAKIRLLIEIAHEFERALLGVVAKAELVDANLNSKKVKPRGRRRRT